jgi:hypothetical protein
MPRAWPCPYSVDLSTHLTGVSASIPRLLWLELYKRHTPGHRCIPDTNRPGLVINARSRRIRFICKARRKFLPWVQEPTRPADAWQGSARLPWVQVDKFIASETAGGLEVSALQHGLGCIDTRLINTLAAAIANTILYVIVELTQTDLAFLGRIRAIPCGLVDCEGCAVPRVCVCECIAPILPM